MPELRANSREPSEDADDLADRLREAAQFVSSDYPGLSQGDRAEWESQFNEESYRLTRLTVGERDELAALLANAQVSRDQGGYERVVTFLNEKLGDNDQEG
jgi:hypothetical protein